LSDKIYFSRLYDTVMRYIVAYDISKSAVRVRVSKILTKYGYRIQLSVFYLPNVTEGELELIYKEIKALINPRTDKVFFYPVEEIEVFKGFPIEPWEVEIV